MIRINPMGLSDPRDNYLVIIDLHTVKQIVRDSPSTYSGVNTIVRKRQNLEITHPQKIYQMES